MDLEDKSVTVVTLKLRMVVAYDSWAEGSPRDRRSGGEFLESLVIRLFDGDLVGWLSGE